MTPWCVPRNAWASPRWSVDITRHLRDSCRMTTSWATRSARWLMSVVGGDERSWADWIPHPGLNKLKNRGAVYLVGWGKRWLVHDWQFLDRNLFTAGIRMSASFKQLSALVHSKGILSKCQTQVDDMDVYWVALIWVCLQTGALHPNLCVAFLMEHDFWIAIVIVFLKLWKLFWDSYERFPMK